MYMYVTSKTHFVVVKANKAISYVIGVWLCIMWSGTSKTLSIVDNANKNPPPPRFSPHGETGGQKDRGNEQALRERCRNDSWDGNGNSDVVRQDCRHSTAQIVA